ncbi:hypothetical protein AAHC03_01501 [Spirometra sp. Aus1]
MFEALGGGTPHPVRRLWQHESTPGNPTQDHQNRAGSWRRTPWGEGGDSRKLSSSRGARTAQLPSCKGTKRGIQDRSKSGGSAHPASETTVGIGRLSVRCWN